MLLFVHDEQHIRLHRVERNAPLDELPMNRRRDIHDQPFYVGRDALDVRGRLDWFVDRCTQRCATRFRT